MPLIKRHLSVEECAADECFDRPSWLDNVSGAERRHMPVVVCLAIMPVGGVSRNRHLANTPVSWNGKRSASVSTTTPSEGRVNPLMTVRRRGGSTRTAACSRRDPIRPWIGSPQAGRRGRIGHETPSHCAKSERLSPTRKAIGSSTSSDPSGTASISSSGSSIVTVAVASDSPSISVSSSSTVAS